MDTIKIAVAGAAGRMGTSIVRCARDLDEVQIAGAYERPGHPDIGKDAGDLSGIAALGLPVADTVATCAGCDALIDFTFHTAAPDSARFAAENGLSLILGTTGLTDDEASSVREATASVPVVWAPNMGLGVNLLFALVRQAAAVVGLDYDAEIVETHHRHKQDAPSGTALRLAENLAAGRKQDLDTEACYGRHGIIGERPHGQIGIHSVRSGDVVGEHTVSFATDGERIELTHKASSRDIFAKGALRAALWAYGRAPGLYDMPDVLGLS